MCSASVPKVLANLRKKKNGWEHQHINFKQNEEIIKTTKEKLNLITDSTKSSQPIARNHHILLCLSYTETCVFFYVYYFSLIFVCGFLWSLNRLLFIIFFLQSPDTQAWQNDYLQGTGCEMYTETLSPSFTGMTFPQASE